MSKSRFKQKEESQSLLSGIESHEAQSLLDGEYASPHRILGAHPCRLGGIDGVVVRAYHPDAVSVECLQEEGLTFKLEPVAEGGLFAGFLPNGRLPLQYRLQFRFADDNVWEFEDPYRFLPTLGDTDLHLFGEGTHRRLWECMGAHPREIDGVRGVSFAVWAPGARRVSVVGEFCGWDGRLLPMRQMGTSGVFELFVPGIDSGTLYKYEIKTQEGAIRLKADPFAFSMEVPPETASRVFESSYAWRDQAWMEQRRHRDLVREPMSVYEVHLGSWMRAGDYGEHPLSYRDIAPKLVEHMKRFGFNYLELLPVAEHPFTGSWGYQVSAYYAPTSRYGSPDDFRYLVDECHRNGIGVIVDWVPAHFPKDDFALRRFDGTALYEHEDPRQGEHPDWGTLIFNYGRNEVRNFLIANALYWLKEYHIDGLRVDAVASMLYLDYSRKAGEWLPNPFGGRENLEAIDFLRATNEVIREDQPGCFTVAEESTAWPGVTRPASEGGLGFTLKWNMGWMHDTLKYFSEDPVHRRYHHDTITFAMLYEYNEHFLMPLSHDEVVHGKRSLLEKMPGDIWQKFANLRLLLAYQFTRPGKMLLFMGTEIAPYAEWDADRSLDWHLATDSWRTGLAAFFGDLGRLYHKNACLWRSDPDPTGFAWVVCDDRDNSILAYQRRDVENEMLIALNFTPVPRQGYVVGVPVPGNYRLVLSSDEERYSGSGAEIPPEIATEPAPTHGHAQSLRLSLPPLAAVIYQPSDR